MRDSTSYKIQRALIQRKLTTGLRQANIRQPDSGPEMNPNHDSPVQSVHLRSVLQADCDDSHCQSVSCNPGRFIITGITDLYRSC